MLGIYLMRYRLLGEKFMYLLLCGVEREIADVKSRCCVKNGKILEILVCLVRVSRAPALPTTLDLDLVSTYELGLSSRSNTGPPSSDAMRKGAKFPTTFQYIYIHFYKIFSDYVRHYRAYPVNKHHSRRRLIAPSGRRFCVDMTFHLFNRQSRPSQTIGPH